jgi:preprotein translocase subunit YajC
MTKEQFNLLILAILLSPFIHTFILVLINGAIESYLRSRPKKKMTAEFFNELLNSLKENKESDKVD